MEVELVNLVTYQVIQISEATSSSENNFQHAHTRSPHSPNKYASIFILIGTIIKDLQVKIQYSISKSIKY